MTISRELGAVYMRIFLVEAAYWIISIGMVFVNEFVLRYKDLTVFITIFQILFSLAILITLNYLTKNYLDPTSDTRHSTTNKNDVNSNDDDPLIVDGSDAEDVLFDAVSDKLINDNGHQNEQGHRIETPDSTVKLKMNRRKLSKTISEQSDKSSQGNMKQLFIVNIPHRINLETCKIVFPLSILYIGMLVMNNLCLENVGVAFYFVSRSLTTVFNVVFTFFLINEPVSRGALVCCGFIVLGFILGIDQESVIGSLSVTGVSFGVASSLFGSLFTIYTKKTLAKLDKNIWVLVLYNNINAILLCTPLLIVHGDIQALISEKVIKPSFWFLLSVSGVMAFFISIVTNASIKYTSPLTHNISGTAKACFQTVIAVVYSNDHKSYLWWISNITILVASAAYSRIKQLEMERRTSADLANQRALMNRGLRNNASELRPESCELAIK
uniref:GDP-fucose transporter 1 n=2 Tax=Aceria tosichella TaxID=561515 RepID=A0A6G1SC19_9ACAR